MDSAYILIEEVFIQLMYTYNQIPHLNSRCLQTVATHTIGINQLNQNHPQILGTASI